MRLSNSLGWSHQKIMRIESEGHSIKFDDLEALARALGVTLDWLTKGGPIDFEAGR